MTLEFDTDKPCRADFGNYPDPESSDGVSCSEASRASLPGALTSEQEDGRGQGVSEALSVFRHTSKRHFGWFGTENTGVSCLWAANL